MTPIGPQPGVQPNSGPSAVEAGEAAEKPSGGRGRRVLHLLGAVLVVVVLPVVLLGVLVGKLGADAALLGLVLGVVGAKVGGTRRMMYVAPAVALAAGLGAGTAYD